MHSDNFLTSSLFNILCGHKMWSPRLLPQNKSLKCFTLSNLDSCTHMLDIPFFLKREILLLSSRAQWYRPLWTLPCHYSRLLWWPPSRSRWVTSLWAAQERWEKWNKKMNRRLTQSIVSTLYTACFIWIFSTALCSSWLLARLCKDHTYRNTHTCRHQLFL